MSAAAPRRPRRRPPLVTGLGAGLAATVVLVVPTVAAPAAVAGAPATAATAVAHSAALVPAAARVRIRLTVGAPKPVARGRAATVRVRVANRSGRRLSGLALSVGRPKGTTVTVVGARKGRLTRTLPALRRGRSVAVSVRVTPGPQAAASSKVAVTVRRKGRTLARSSAAVRVAGGPAPTPGPAPKPANPYLGRLFWNSTYNGTTTFLHGYWFSGEGFAYRGIPEGGLPTCTAVTAAGDDDGCVPTTFDPATGALTVNAVPAVTVDANTIRVGDTTFDAAAVPAPGTRWDVAGRFINAYGLCPLSCTFVNSGLKMTASGQFARGGDVSADTPEQSFGALPPDQRGTYAIGDAGRLTFTYASGKVQTQTIASMTDDAGAPNPGFGFLLDDAAYFGPQSDAG